VTFNSFDRPDRHGRLGSFGTTEQIKSVIESQVLVRGIFGFSRSSVHFGWTETTPRSISIEVDAPERPTADQKQNLKPINPKEKMPEVYDF